MASRISYHGVVLTGDCRSGKENTQQTGVERNETTRMTRDDCKKKKQAETVCDCIWMKKNEEEKWWQRKMVAWLYCPKVKNESVSSPPNHALKEITKQLLYLKEI